MISIHDEAGLKEILIANGHKTFRYSQIENAIYKNFVTNFDGIQTISKDLRELLNRETYYSSLTILEQIESADKQTTKILWKTKK